MICSVEGCQSKSYLRHLCRSHYFKGLYNRSLPPPEKPRKHGRFATCRINTCYHAHSARGLCDMHYSRWRRTGKTESSRSSNGAGNIDAHGYRRISTERGRVKEHRQVMGKILGRPLRRNEDVHHINGDRADNRPRNLKVMTRSQHLKIHRVSRAHKNQRRA